MAAKPPSPSDLADKFMLRLPEGMRDRIAEAAKASGRSMNAEIVARLDQSFSIPDALDQLDRRIAALEGDRNA